MDRVFPYAHPMAQRTPLKDDVQGLARVLAENVRSLMDANKELSSNPKLGKESGLGASAISRVVNGHNATLETIEAIAVAFELQPWQLLVPGLDPSHPPVIQPVSAKEKALWDRIKEAAKELAKE